MTLPEPKTASDTFETSLDKALKNNEVTEQELAELRAFVSCTSDKERIRLQGILDKKYLEKKDIKAEIKAQLQILLSECKKRVESMESSKISSFEQVFEGTKSEQLSSENMKKISNLIDEFFPENLNLSIIQRENIHLAMTDRLLKNPKIQALFDVQIGVVDILGSIAEKGPKTAENVKNAKESLSVRESISQADMIVKTFIEQVVLSVQPLSTLLKEKAEKKESLPAQLLSNPKAIAVYEGGEVSANIKEMSPMDIRAYISSLNGEIRKIDVKILGMEQVREGGMDFLVNAPSFLVDFFKWLLSFDFIAKIFGYTGNENERNAQLDEELKQRRSLGILREFGRVPDISEGKPEGTKKYGKYEGGIRILKEKDLSKISRTKLSPFFAFTKEEGINIETPDFWMMVFNEEKIIGKDTEGKRVSYTIAEIKGGDLDDNFKGLYEKLNKLKEQNDAKKAQEAYEQENKKGLESEQHTITSLQEQEYKDLAEWNLNTRDTGFSIYTLSQMKDVSIREAIEKKGNKRLFTLYSVIHSLNQAQVSQFERYLQQQKTSGKKADSFAHIYEHRKYLLSMVGYKEQNVGNTEKFSIADINRVVETMKMNIPITEIPVGTDKICFDLDTQLISYKRDSYRIHLVEHPDVRITKISRISDTQIQFEHNSIFGTKPNPVSIDDFSNGLLTMIGNGKYEKKEGGKVIMSIEKVV